MSDVVNVIGGGLGGVEAAWQAAEMGAWVRLYEMRPVMQTPAHRTDKLAEIVCSNSLKTDEPGTAPYLLKEELRRGRSLVMEAAEATRVPAGSALSVDRIKFAEFITEKIEQHPNIEIVREEVKAISDLGFRISDSLDERVETNSELETARDSKSEIRNPKSEIVIVATGPLTSEALTESIMQFTGDDQLYFYDAIAPIIAADSIDMSIAFKAARYGKGGDDYINCPMDRDQYETFINELLVAKSVPLKRFEETRWFESCLPIEEIARRGVETLRFGPMKPKGLAGSKNGIRAVCVRAASTGKSDGRCIRHGRFSKSSTLRRAGACASPDPGFGECRVSSIWADPSKYIHQLSEDSQRRSFDEKESAALFRRADNGCRRLCRIRRDGLARRDQRSARFASAADADRSYNIRDRLLVPVCLECRDEELSAGEYHIRFARAAAGRVA